MERDNLKKGQLASLEEVRHLIKSTGFSLENAENIAKEKVSSFIEDAIRTLPLEDLNDLLAWINTHE